MTISPNAQAHSAIGENGNTWLRLYVAAGTPNSARAERNLQTALDKIGGKAAELHVQIIDVFNNAKRALVDGVIVTPTLIGHRLNQRLVMMGDLTDADKLQLMLTSLMREP